MSVVTTVAPVVYDDEVAPEILLHDDVAVDSAFCHWYETASWYVVVAVTENVRVAPCWTEPLEGCVEMVGAAPTLKMKRPLPPSPPIVR